jgi:metallo-beta-lactamase family protein
VKLAFHGAAHTVTGSRHLLTVNGHQLLLDCGLFQGRRRDTYERNLTFTFSPSDVEAVILSHAHIDHSGNLPNLVRRGFRGSIHATRPTVRLTDVMLQDSGHIQESDIAFLNKRRRGQPPLEPLYTQRDAARVAPRLIGHAYGEEFQPIPGVTARLVEAGHMLGSAAVLLDLQEADLQVRLLFSGDIGRPGLPIIRDPTLPEGVDYLLMECTYGDRTHDTPETARSQFRDVILRTTDRGGKVVLPAFAVGRTQTLVYYLHEMVAGGQLPRIPVFVDSPLAINITEIYRNSMEEFDQEVQSALRRDPQGTIFGFDMLTYTLTAEESRAINDTPGPAIIISASGMAETGRILHHLRHTVGDPGNTVLITSWMAPDTLGRRLADGARRVRIFGEEHEVRARVVVIDGLSSHADQPFLAAYARAAMPRLRRVFLVHGESGPAAALTAELHRAGIRRVKYPAHGEEVSL